MANSILQDLENHKIRVFIIGAGFSVPAGAPVMSNFVSKARELFTSSDLAQFQKDNFKTVFEFQNSLGGAQRRFNLDTENIEQLFGIAEWAKHVNVHGSGKGKGIKDYTALKNMVGATLAHTVCLSPNRKTYLRHRFIFNSEDIFCPAPDYIRDYQSYFDPELSIRNSYDMDQYMESGNALCSPYEAFLYNLNEDSKKTGIKNFFITLNYDTVLEFYMGQLGIPFTRLGVEMPAPNFKSKNFYVLKPHGSLDWIIKDGLVRASKEIPKKFDNAVLIPPTWSKTNLASNDSLAKTIGQIWNDGIAVIHNAYQINILGFSLPDSDQYIRSLLIFGLAKNIKLSKINVVDVSEQTLAKWEKLLRNEFNQGLVQLSPKGMLDFFRDANTTLGYETYPQIIPS